MWNNITHGNTNMNKFERLMEHKGHLERLTQAKKVINTKNPITPSFITKKMINPGTKMERAMKINYENHLIYNRMYGISCKNSPYSACMNGFFQRMRFGCGPNQLCVFWEICGSVGFPIPVFQVLVPWLSRQKKDFAE